MIYVDKYKGGEEILPGDLVSCRKLLEEKTVYEDGKKKVIRIPLQAEVVHPAHFTNYPPTKICVIFKKETCHGFHCHGTVSLPRDNGGYTFVDAKHLTFICRRKPGQSVFDPAPERKRRRDWED